MQKSTNIIHHVVDKKEKKIYMIVSKDALKLYLTEIPKPFMINTLSTI